MQNVDFNETAIERYSQRSGSPARIDEEVNEFIEKISSLKHDSDIIVAVTRQGTVEALRRKLQKKMSRLISFKSQPPVYVTDDISLQNAIGAVQSSDSNKYLTIVVSVDIDFSSLCFEVSRPVRRLRLERCAYGANAHGQLFLNGFSTFRGTKLQRWDGSQKGKLLLGPGVVIQVNPGDPSWDDLQVDFSFSDDDKKRIGQHVDRLAQTAIEGQWWEAIRGPMSSILGMLAGTAKFASSIKFSAGGAFVQYQWGAFGSLKAGMAQTTFSAGAAYGPIVVAAGVAAAIYFVPWRSVFDWFSRALGWIWERLKGIWNKIKEWLSSCFSTVFGGADKHKQLARPMKF